MTSHTYFAVIPSPLGRILLAGDGAGLRRISLLDGARPLTPEADWIEDPVPLVTPPAN